MNQGIVLLSIFLFAVIACGNQTSKSSPPAGEDKTAKTKTLEAGADVLQNRDPIDQINMYVNGFHFTSGNMNHQMEAHHYCTKVNEDFTQCVLYDGNEKPSRLIGIEYIVSKKLFEPLPEEEKAYWHSHVFEVKSGQLIAPGIPDAAEHELMELLIGTYGKTWHTWTNEKENIPMGIPALMMGFTADGQIQRELAANRDKRMNVSADEKRENRKDIQAPEIDPGADAWQKGKSPQLQSGTTAGGRSE